MSCRLRSLDPVQPVRLRFHVFISSVPRAGAWLASRQGDKESQALPPSTFLTTGALVRETWLTFHPAKAWLCPHSGIQQEPHPIPLLQLPPAPSSPKIHPSCIRENALRSVRTTHTHTSCFSLFPADVYFSSPKIRGVNDELLLHEANAVKLGHLS